MRRQRILLLGVLLLYAAIALWYTAMVPLGEGVDEGAHFDYVLFMKDNHRLPVQRAQGSIDTQMAHHPPFYYALNAALISPIDTSDRAEVLYINPHFIWDTKGERGWNVMLPAANDRFPWQGALLAFRLVRLFNIVLGACTIACVYLAARRLMRAQPWAPSGAAAIVGLNPSFIYMASTIHHDTLEAALFSAGLLWCVVYAGRRLSAGTLLAIGVLIACATLTKLSGASLALVVSLLLFIRQPHEGDWGNRIGQILLVGITAFLLTGWWFIRNQVLYGDLFGWQMFLTVFNHTARHGPFSPWLFVNDFLAGFAQTFWGAFGFMHILLPPQIWWVAWALAAIALFGWVFILARQLRRPTLDRDRLVAWIVIGAGLVLLFLSFVRMAFSVIGAGHGRYLFPAAVAIGALLVAGINGYNRWRWQKPISLLLLGGMAVYAFWAPATYAWPKYRVPPTAAVEVAAAGQTGIAFENGLRLAAVKASSGILIPGQGLDITTYWAADRDVDPNLDPLATISLQWEDGQPFDASKAFFPELSTSPRVWGDRIIKNVQSFYVPPEVRAGKLLVGVSVVDHATGRPIAVVSTPGANQAIVDELLALGQAEIIAPSDVPRHDLAAVFADAIRLETATMPANIESGGVLPVELFWNVLAPPPRDYTIFVHVLDQAGKLVAQLDRPPGGGTSPTSGWQSGAYLHDTYPVPLPPDLAPGRYRVVMGLYVWPELTRQAVVANGAAPADSLEIGEVTVGK